MAETSSPLFAQYEREYATKSTEASRKIQSLGPLRGDQRQKRVKEAEADLLEAEHILQRLDIEARSLPPVTSRALLQKLKDYKADIAKLRSDAKTAGTSSVESRAELGLGNEYFQTSAGQRDRLLTATDRLGKTSDRIQAGRQQLLETEVGGGFSCSGCREIGEGLMVEKGSRAGFGPRLLCSASVPTESPHGSWAHWTGPPPLARSMLSRRWGRRSCSSSRASGRPSSAAETRQRPWGGRWRRQTPRHGGSPSPGGSRGADAHGASGGSAAGSHGGDADAPVQDGSRQP
ncbi:VTI1B [Auxenochlorella protothecoides x Auxenochlorella symbiontica]